MRRFYIGFGSDVIYLGTEFPSGVCVIEGVKNKNYRLMADSIYVVQELLCDDAKGIYMSMIDESFALGSLLTSKV